MGVLGAHLVNVSMNPNQKLLKDEGELFEDAKRFFFFYFFIFFININYLVKRFYLFLFYFLFF
jgi:hypothetical protein